MKTKQIIQIFSIVSLLTLSIFSVLSVKNYALTNKPVKIAVPLYSYPYSDWQVFNKDWVNVADTQKAYGNISAAIVNVNNGPNGLAADEANYKIAIQMLKDAGVPVYGYIDSGYMGVGLTKINAQAQAWKNKYGVDRYFIDQVSTGCSLKSKNYYSAVAKYTSPVIKPILNPGVVGASDECLMNYSSMLLSYENEASKYINTMNSYYPSWVYNYPSSRFWHILHTVNSADYQTQVNTIKSYNASNVYLTDDVMPNPYDSLSGFWAGLQLVY